ncbi:MAG: hypothetical protein HY791_03155 [Deltaproteobacteria bacterium]|nr:hypothetical protein [Deltaproteobacteria bacterium]
MHPVQSIILAKVDSVTDAGDFTPRAKAALSQGLAEAITSVEALDAALIVVGLLLERGIERLAQSLVEILAPIAQRARRSASNRLEAQAKDLRTFLGEAQTRAPRSASPSGVPLRALYIPKRF